MIRIYPTVFSGNLTAPPSTPHAQRLLFAAALSNTPTTIYNMPASQDIDTTISCLEALGCKIIRKANSVVTVSPFAKTNLASEVHFDFRNSAACSRFALTIASAFGIQTNCIASEALKRRPLVPLASRMAVRGVTFSSFSFPLTTQGRLESGEYFFQGDEGSQYICSLLLALPILPGPSSIRLSSPLLMEGYVDITISMLKRFGITINKVPGGYDIPGRQIYKTTGKATVDNDWSLAALWLTAGALSQDRGGLISCSNLPPDSPQGYRNLSEMMSQLITDFKTIYVNAQNFPAMVPLIAIVAAAGVGTAYISGVPQLRYKQTDRLKTLVNIIRAMGGGISEMQDGLRAEGKGSMTYPEDFYVDCQGDPNIAISFALGACVLDKPFLLDESSVDKTWPDFFNVYRSLGGKFEVVENSIDM